MSSNCYFNLHVKKALPEVTFIQLKAKYTQSWEDQKKLCKDPELVNKSCSLKDLKESQCSCTQWAKGNNDVNNVGAISKKQMLSQDNKFRFYSKCNDKVLNREF